jgi:hypothetical protein
MRRAWAAVAVAQRAVNDAATLAACSVIRHWLSMLQYCPSQPAAVPDMKTPAQPPGQARYLNAKLVITIATDYGNYAVTFPVSKLSQRMTMSSMYRPVPVRSRTLIGALLHDRNDELFQLGGKLPTEPLPAAGIH